MERLPVAEPLRGSDFRGKAAWNDGLGETDLQQRGAIHLMNGLDRKPVCVAPDHCNFAN